MNLKELSISDLKAAMDYFYSKAIKANEYAKLKFPDSILDQVEYASEYWKNFNVAEAEFKTRLGIN